MIENSRVKLILAHKKVSDTSGASSSQMNSLKYNYPNVGSLQNDENSFMEWT